jgi:hypothetical protein
MVFSLGSTLVKNIYLIMESFFFSKNTVSVINEIQSMEKNILLMSVGCCQYGMLEIS